MRTARSSRSADDLGAERRPARPRDLDELARSGLRPRAASIASPAMRVTRPRGLSGAARAIASCSRASAGRHASTSSSARASTSSCASIPASIQPASVSTIAPPGGTDGSSRISSGARASSAGEPARRAADLRGVGRAAPGGPPGAGPWPPASAAAASAVDRAGARELAAEDLARHGEREPRHLPLRLAQQPVPVRRRRGRGAPRPAPRPPGAPPPALPRGRARGRPPPRRRCAARSPPPRRPSRGRGGPRPRRAASMRRAGNGAAPFRILGSVPMADRAGAAAVPSAGGCDHCAPDDARGRRALTARPADERARRAAGQLEVVP